MSEVKKETKTKKTVKVKEEKAKKTKVKDEKIVKEEKKTRVKKVSVEKKEKALLDDKDQIRCKALCKIIKILVKIGRVCLMIALPFIFLSMIVVPIVFKNFQIEANIIKFDDLVIIVNDDNLIFKMGNSTDVIKANPVVLDRITTFLTDNSKGSIITFIELSLLLVSIIVLLDIYLLIYIEKLFANFVNKHTPFIEENAKYIFKIALIVSVIKFISICLNTVGLNYINVNFMSIISILIIYAIYFIFKYAVKLQSKNKTVIYD